MNLFKRVIEAIQKEKYEFKVENVYLFGSRLYNCHTETSDYDIIVMVSGKVFENSILIDTEDLNINIYHQDFFNFIIDENVIWISMLLWVPQEFVLLENVNIKDKYFLDLKKLKGSTIQDSNHCFAKAKKLFDTNRKISLKNIAHSFRWVWFAKDIIRNGKITNFEVANDLLKELNSSKEKEWSYFEKKYWELLHTEMHELQEMFSIEPKDYGKNLAQHTEKYGIESLSRDFSIHYHKLNNFYFCWIEKDLNLIYIEVVKKNSLYFVGPPVRGSPILHPIQEECEGEGCIILDKKSYKVLEFHKGLSQMKFKEKIDGVNVLMFWNGDEWSTVSKEDFLPVFKRKSTSNKFLQENYKQYPKMLPQSTSEIFWKVFEEKKYQIPSKENIYSFELCVKGCSKVVQHTENKLVLVGVKNISEQKALDINEFKEYELPKEYDEISIENVLKNLNKIDPLKLEGFIGVDKDQNMARFVSRQYYCLSQLKYHELLDKNTIQRLILEIARTNDQDTFLKYPPWDTKEIAQIYKESKLKHEESIKKLENTLKDLNEKSEGSHEKFIKLAESNPLNFVFYEIKKQNLTIQEFLASLNYQRYLKIIKGLV